MMTPWMSAAVRSAAELEETLLRTRALLGDERAEEFRVAALELGRTSRDPSETTAKALERLTMEEIRSLNPSH